MMHPKTDPKVNEERQAARAAKRERSRETLVLALIISNVYCAQDPDFRSLSLAADVGVGIMRQARANIDSTR